MPRILTVVVLGVHALAWSAKVKQAKIELPADVQSYLERRLECNHWGGEDGYDAERVKEITKAVEKLHCEDLDDDEKALLKKHQNRRSIVDTILAADSSFI